MKIGGFLLSFSFFFVEKDFLMERQLNHTNISRHKGEAIGCNAEKCKYMSLSLSQETRQQERKGERKMPRQLQLFCCV